MKSLLVKDIVKDGTDNVVGALSIHPNGALSFVSGSEEVKQAVLEIGKDGVRESYSEAIGENTFGIFDKRITPEDPMFEIVVSGYLKSYGFDFN